VIKTWVVFLENGDGSIGGEVVNVDGVHLSPQLEEFLYLVLRVQVIAHEDHVGSLVNL